LSYAIGYLFAAAAQALLPLDVTSIIQLDNPKVTEPFVATDITIIGIGATSYNISTISSLLDAESLIIIISA
jgi:hypothetical protein